MGKLRTNVIGFDDAPLPRDHRGDVLLVGAVCSRTRLDGVVSARVRRDGSNATRVMVEAIQRSQFAEHVRAVLLQGIAVAGFNVVDVHALHDALGIPVVAIVRRQPDYASIRRALFARVPGAARKWRLIERAGKLDPVRGVLVQRVGITIDHARELLAATTLHGNLPEPLRLAHLIAGGVTPGSDGFGTSRGRA
jgi:endonuclease V-like protein UPF0215 family